MRSACPTIQTKCFCNWCLLCLLLTLQISLVASASTRKSECQHSGNGRLQYMWGDALRNSDCVGPDGLEYPNILVDSIVTNSVNVTLRQKREAASQESWDSERLRLELLDRWLWANGNVDNSIPGPGRRGKDEKDGTKKCHLEAGSKLCETEYNTTAPLFGVSMTSGDTVAIVQKFPDLLQQVVYERCLHPECQMLKGSCHQSYVPYLLLTVPLGPVTLTGQDYILVESGCVCKMTGS